MKFLFSKFVLFIFSFTIILFFNIQFFNITIFSQDDKKGFGVQERERARIHAENNSQIFNNDFAGLIILVTIIVIVGVSSYALYKILIIRRKSNHSKPKK